ncbi:histidine phosphatase family protein [Nocardia sp. NPDC052254]|uniref:histidine phosphatase family protein n=1 Tax=Nocardia sp. NPDC052254 TaxID=3155681 RepID=UPI003442FAB3
MTTGVTRLTLISHGMTEAMRAARFPIDEPIERITRDIAPDSAVSRADLVQVGPEVRAAQTAGLLNLSGTTEPALRDLDSGRWAGSAMDALAPEDLMGWLSDPGYRGHGGESVTEVIDRVRTWLRACAPLHRRVVAVTHPAVIRASVLVALSAPPESFWRIDIPPLSATTLHGRGPAWTLRHTANPL